MRADTVVLMNPEVFQVVFLVNGKVNALAEDDQGAIWLAFEGMGLIRFQDGKSEAFGLSNGLPSVDVRKVLCDIDGRLWAVAGGQLSLFEGDRWRSPGGGAPGSQTVRTVNQARDGGLWITTRTVNPVASRDLRVYKLRERKWSAQLEPYP
jgi:ligand-binding sensor domain-containing protein